MSAVWTMKDRSNEPKLLTGNEEPLDYFSASVGSQVVKKEFLQLDVFDSARVYETEENVKW